MDTETGLYYFSARYYDPKYSIFLSVDPLADKYPSMSPYMYCGGNPIRFIDPTGMSYGDYYTESGKWFYNDGQDDDKAYVAKQGTDGKPVGAKDLGITNTELKHRANWVYGECRGSSEVITNRTQNAGDANTISDARVADYYAAAINNIAKAYGSFYKGAEARMSMTIDGKTQSTYEGYFTGTGLSSQDSRGRDRPSAIFAKANTAGIETLMKVDGAQTAISAVIKSVTSFTDPTGGARAWRGDAAASPYVGNPNAHRSGAAIQFSFSSGNGKYFHSFFRNK